MDVLKEILEDVKWILSALIPTLAIIFIELKSKWNKAKTDKIRSDKNKALEIYDKWEHEESKEAINKIKNLCNYYKDKGQSDLVQYLQLENGTMATSKIQNMFMTCLAEDDRAGNIPKMIKLLQRMPYSETTCWLNKLTEVTSEGEFVLKTPDLSKAEYNRTRIEGVNGIGSVMVAPVFDPGNVLLGICVFFYHQKEYNGHEKDETVLMQRFRTATESVILMYHTARKDKKHELGLDGDE